MLYVNKKVEVMNRMAMFLFLFLFLFFPSVTFACGGFGNSGAGCTDEVSGVQTEAGVHVEITTNGITWATGHVCEGTTVTKFSGTELEREAALSIAMASYLAGKGPVFFRCNEKLSSSTCRCTNIGLGNSRRD